MSKHPKQEIKIVIERERNYGCCGIIAWTILIIILIGVIFGFAA